MIKITNCNNITLYDDIINKLLKENIYIENCEFIYFMSSDKQSNECSNEKDKDEDVLDEDEPIDDSEEEEEEENENDD